VDLPCEVTGAPARRRSRIKYSKMPSTKKTRSLGHGSSSYKTHDSSLYASSFAVMVIFAFNTFETGQPFSAASAYF